MSAPPGLAPVDSPRRFHRTATGEAGGTAPSFEDVLRLAESTAAAQGVRIGHQRSIRLVRAFMATRQPLREFASWVIAYADPTGETAVRNVMRERS